MNIGRNITRARLARTSRLRNWEWAPAAILGLLVTLNACTVDRTTTSAMRVPATPSSAQGRKEKVDICHLADGNSNNISVSMSALQSHLAHGDYIAGFKVQPASTGNDGINFSRITDALDAATAIRRARNEKTSASCRITIAVAPGEYMGSFGPAAATLERFPLLITVPAVTLKGALDMPLDEDGRALGASATGATTLLPDRALAVNEVIVVVSDETSGYAGNDAVVSNLRFRSGYPESSTTFGGAGIGSLRVRDLVISGNHFEPGLAVSIDLRASRAAISRNYGRRIGICNFCLGGPGNYDVSGNRLLDGGFVSLFLTPIAVRPNFPLGVNAAGVTVAPFVAPAAAADSATVTNNDFSFNVRNTQGLGLGIRLLPYASDAPNTIQSAVIRVTGNRLYKNTFALSVDANTPLEPKAAAQPGRMQLTLEKNTIGPSCRNDLLISFTRISRSVGTPPQTQSYLRNSAYTLAFDDEALWGGAWYDHPEGYGNTLLVNGNTIPNGRRTSPSSNPAGCP